MAFLSHRAALFLILSTNRRLGWNHMSNFFICSLDQFYLKSLISEISQPAYIFISIVIAIFMGCCHRFLFAVHFSCPVWLEFEFANASVNYCSCAVIICSQYNIVSALLRFRSIQWFAAFGNSLACKWMWNDLLCLFSLDGFLVMY